MEREQIIKALECCIKNQCENCCQCGNWHEQWNCMTFLMKNAVALIKELTEENERLRAIPEQLHKEMSERMIEERKIERKLTARKMQERLIAEFRKDDRMNYYLRMTLDQIAKEILEGK